MYASDLKHPAPALEKKLALLYALSREKKIDLSFRPPYLDLLKKLGNPHTHLPPVIHVAGTNGKGSTIAMLRSILETAGYKVHAYTSPHLIRFNERIVLAGKQIEDGPLETLIDEVLELNAGADITFFEITTAMAFAAFAQTPADICLLETGLGGRLDCTNIIENPLLTVITAIGMDHTEILGNTRAKIAEEKAGIMKPQTPCIIAAQTHKDVMNVFENKAATLGIALHDPDRTKTVPALPGPHQKQNAATALKALELIKNKYSVTPRHIETGLQNVDWPARLQEIAPNIFLDGGHNANAGQALARQAALWQKDAKPLSVILGMMQKKDAKNFLKPLLPFIDNLYVVDIENEPQSQSAGELLKIFPRGRACGNYREALHHIDTAHQRTLICGSLYLAGHVLQDTRK
ncbi:MAG: folylpolyglutamate synthase/dihydrofolate synthase family protein [Alphaproteobacteria bacterium]